MSELLRAELVRLLSLRPASRAELIPLCRGASPAEIQECLADLLSAGRVAADSAGTYCIAEPGQCALLHVPLAALEKLRTILEDAPEPHQLNCEWRFTADSASLVVSRLLQLAGRHGRIGFLGAPTAYLLACLSGYGPRAVLINNPSPTVDYLRSLNLDGSIMLADGRCGGPPELIGALSALIVDAPWYLDHLVPFLSTSAAMLMPGGYLLCTVFPPLTRPTAIRERHELIGAAPTLDLGLVSLESAVLRYVTPPFEVATLRCQGIHSPDAWRSADLLTFVRGSDVHVGQKVIGAQQAEEWHDYLLGTRVIKLRDRRTCDGPRVLQPLSDGHTVLPTVSRRYALTHEVGLWSSLNDVYRVSEPAVVGRALELLTERIEGDRVAEDVQLVQLARTSGISEDSLGGVVETLISIANMKREV